MKAKMILVLAMAGLCTVSAPAMTMDETGTPSTGWDNPGGWGGLDGAGSFGPGASGMGTDPGGGVVVICHKGSPICDPQSTLSPVDVIYVPAITMEDVWRDPDIWTDERKQKCLNGCALAKTVADNNCAIAKADLAVKLAGTLPGGSNPSPGGALLRMFRSTRKFGDVADWGNTAYNDAKAEVDRKVNDFSNRCLANSAAAQNSCISSCHAFFLAPLALLPLRRRRPEQEERRLAYA